jgi:hypothetical protein
MDKTMNTTPAPTPPLDLTESAAGEEDPGAGIDIPATPGAREAPCPDCGGSGRRAGGVCPTCHGTGKLAVGAGGA